MDFLESVIPNQYAGLNREQASRKAVEICQKAAHSGQTLLAAEHLNQLAPIIQRG